MTDIKKLIEEEAERYAARYTMPKQAVAHMAVIAGALWAARWWAERYARLGTLTNEDGDEEKRILAELDEAAKQILEGEWRQDCQSQKESGKRTAVFWSCWC